MVVEQQQHSSTQESAFFDATSALKLAESRDVIEDFVLDFCGLKRVYKKNGDVEIKRFSQPMFTYEFAKKLTSFIYMEVNRITSRTDFEKEELTRYYIKGSEVMSEYFSHVGINHLISDRAWELILELGSGTDKIRDEDGNIFFDNKWYQKFGIIWDYNKPVNIDMLRIIKTQYGLDNEAFAQDVILRQIFWDVRVFVHGGLARSKDHLTLDHEKVIHKESFLSNQQNPEEPKEGFFDRIRKGFRII
jgi:hypothetical protein